MTNPLELKKTPNKKNKLNPHHHPPMPARRANKPSVQKKRKLTTTASPPSPPRTAPVKNAHVNPKLQELYLAFRAQGGRIANAKRKKKPPTNNQGIPMCVSFHSKGDCVDRCNAKQDHAHHDPQEDLRLLAWMRDHMVVPPPATTSS